MAVCSKCGLPEELCVCENISKEQQNIRIYTEEKRYRKKMTIIEGLDNSSLDIKALTKKLKSKLACGGTYKNDKVELQGDHKQKVLELLKKEGFSENNIEVM